MSSLHQDGLLDEGPVPTDRARVTFAPARATSRRPVEDQPANAVPTQRQGKSQRTGTTTTTASTTATNSTASTASASTTAPGERAAARSSAAAPKRTTAAKAAAAASGAAGSLAARAKQAKVATIKAAGPKAATARTATAKAATAAKAAAVAKVATRTASGRAAAAKRVPEPAAAATATAAEVTAVAKPAVTAEPAAKSSEPAAPKPAVLAEATAVATPTAAAARVQLATSAARAAEAKPATAATAVAATTTRAVGGRHAAPRKNTAGAPSPVTKDAPVKPAGKPRHAAPGRSTAAERAAGADGTAATATSDARPTPGPRTPAVLAPAPAVVDGRLAGFRRHTPSVSRQPGLYLAAALVGAFAIGSVIGDDPAARATDTMSHSVSVAEELGIQAQPTDAISPTAAAERLGELSASRNLRDAEQAAAAHVQAEADRIAAEAAAEAARPKAVLPVEGARLTSTFGPRWGTLHAGIDLAAPMRTPEYAAMDGIVLEAGPASGYGLAVYIQHDNGDVTVYGHMDSILVQAGQVVRAGDTIALLGNRGQSTGPHLHFEVHVGGLNGRKVDPLPWLRERGVNL
jgi:murein DD-endopeptidase MepM/ murein hydrolase activator NlpD